MNILDFIYNFCLVNWCPVVPNETIGETGPPLFLTPLIESGHTSVAQRVSEVHFYKFGDVKSYSGFLTVNQSTNSNLFFWFFPAVNGYPDVPVVLWLQGGPGSTGLFGLFNEMGPFTITKDQWVEQRPYSWNQNYSVIFIDNPVGAGFSFTDDPKAYPTNMEEMASDLYVALVQILQLFPEVQSNEFYIFGESYGGKYVPAIGYKILQENPGATTKINLQGLAIGDGISDPINQLEYAEYLYEASLIDLNVKKQMEELQNRTKQLIMAEKWSQASDSWNDIIELYDEVTGGLSPYNYVTNRSEAMFYPKFLDQPDTRKALHVGHLKFVDASELVYFTLYEDLMKSVAPWVAQLLSNYRMLIYNGQLDVMVAYPLTDNYLQKLNFSSADEFQTAKRQIWRVQGKVAGYYKVAGNLTQLLLRNTGHLAPGDQPLWTYEMLQKFTSKNF